MSERLPNLGEYPKLPVYYLAERLGFHETLEMNDLRHDAIQAMAQHSEHTALLLTQYRVMGEEIVDAQAADTINAARIGLNISSALICRDGGKMDSYSRDLTDVWEDLENLIYSGQQEFVTIADIIIEELGRSVG